MPTLPKLLLKTSDTHNFWPVAPKIMKFVLTQSLLWDAFEKEIQETKNSVRSYNEAQNWFVPCRDKWSFRVNN
jgi:hypothetical protein